MDDDSSSSAALVAQWRDLRDRGFASAVGSSNGSSEAVAVSDSAIIQLVETAAGRRYELDAEPGSYAVTPAAADLVFQDHPPTVLVQPPELMLGVSLVVPGDRTDEGLLIGAVTPVWRRFLNELAISSTAFNRLDWRQTEELVAGPTGKTAGPSHSPPAVATRVVTSSRIEMTSARFACSTR